MLARLCAPLGLEIRAGVHTGEVEVVGSDVAGIAVHTGARVAALAAPGEVLVSSTVKDLVAGSGIEFEERGEHELKGVPGRGGCMPSSVPETRYAKSGDVNIAYQVVGEGPIDLVLVPGFISHLEIDWDYPAHAYFLGRLASFSRLILFDKRGTGLSDRPGGLPDLETRMDDVRAVMDAAGSERAALFGYSEGGPMCSLFAATYPERTSALVLYGTYAKRQDPDEEYPWVMTRDEREAYADEVEREWGSESDFSRYTTSQDEELIRWWQRRARRLGQPRSCARTHTHEQPDRRAPCAADDPRADARAPPAGRRRRQRRRGPVSRRAHP